MNFTIISNSELGQVDTTDSVYLPIIFVSHEEANVIHSSFCLITAACCVLQGTYLALHIFM